MTGPRSSRGRDGASWDGAAEPVAAPPAALEQDELLDVRRDEVLLDRLGRREPVASPDPLVGLLAALAADVDTDLAADVAANLGASSDAYVGAGLDTGLGAELAPRTAVLLGLVDASDAADPGRVGPGGDAARCGEDADVRTPRHRRRGRRAVVAAMVVGAALASTSGVAAAVTGDPLAPYRPVLDSVLGGHPVDRDAGPGDATTHGAVAGTDAGTDPRSGSGHVGGPGVPGAARSGSGSGTGGDGGAGATGPGQAGSSSAHGRYGDDGTAGASDGEIGQDAGQDGRQDAGRAESGARSGGHGGTHRDDQEAVPATGADAPEGHRLGSGGGEQGGDQQGGGEQGGEQGGGEQSGDHATQGGSVVDGHLDGVRPHRPQSDGSDGGR